MADQIVKVEQTSIEGTSNSASDDMEEAIDEAMEAIRSSNFLTDEVNRVHSVLFLYGVSERCMLLAGEIFREGVKARSRG